MSRFVPSELLVSYSVTGSGRDSHRSLDCSYFRSFELSLVRLLEVLGHLPLPDVVCDLTFLL